MEDKAKLPQAMAKDKPSKLRVVYRPRGRALEYSPLAVNIATGCTHGCLYCYAPSCLQRKREEYHETYKIRANIEALFARDLVTLDAAGDVGPILFCFVTDAYQGHETAAVTRRMLEQIQPHAVRFCVLTKRPSLAVRDLDLYREGDAFAVTLTYWDEADSLRVEPRADLPQARLSALKEAHKRGVTTWASFEPALDEAQAHRLLEASLPFVDLYKFGKVSRYPGCSITDWRAYAQGVIDVCERHSKNYYIKDDLRKHLG